MTVENDTAMNGAQFRCFVQGLRQLVIQKHRSDYKLGEFFSNIQYHNLHTRWPRTDRRRPGYTTLKEFCDKELGYSLSKFGTLSRNYRRLSQLNIDEQSDTFSRCMRLGWSKLEVLLRVAGDENNLLLWLNDIEGKNLSELQLRGRIQEARRANVDQDTAPTGGDDGDESDETPEPIAPTAGTTAGYVGHNFRFDTQESLDAVLNAVETIRNRYNADMGVGQCLMMMALTYMQTRARDEEGGAPLTVESLLLWIEATWGVKLAVVKKKRRRRRRATATPDE